MHEDETRDQEQNHDNASDESPETEAESERTFTQAEVEEIVKQRLARDRRKQRAKGRTTKATTKQEKAEEGTQGVDDPGAWRDRFYDTIHGLDLTRAQIRKMRDDFRRSEPTDPDAWVDEWTALFGLDSDAETEETETNPEPKHETKAEPVSDKPEGNRGAPQPRPDYETMIDPNRLTADDIRRMEQKFGKNEAYKKIRQMVEGHYRGRPVQLPKS